MFRYGGPIKEGVMSGIREPKKNGGSMREAQQWNTVGSPAFPKDSSGRAHHFLPAGYAIGAGLSALGRMALRPFGSWAMKQIPKLSRVKYTPSTYGQRGAWSQIASKNMPKMDAGWQFKPNPIGKWFAGGPEAGLAKGIWAGKGYVGKPISYLAKSPITLGGLIWTGVSWLRKDGTPANENEIAKAKASTGGPPGGGDPGMQGTGEWFAEQAEKEALAKKQKEFNNRIKKYRDIMDIKGMNKEAAYKSLVDASKLIQESGDFKGDLRSGKLINQVIQAASKQFDKPAKTSDAINTLILQNELKKDLSAETDALDKAYKQSAILLNQKKLAGESLSETINASYQRTGQFPSGATLAGVARTKGIDAQVLPTKDIPKDTEALDYIVSIVTESHTNPKKSPFPPGDYVIKDRLITVDETGKVTPLI